MIAVVASTFPVGQAIAVVMLWASMAASLGLVFAWWWCGPPPKSDVRPDGFRTKSDFRTEVELEQQALQRSEDDAVGERLPLDGVGEVDGAGKRRLKGRERVVRVREDSGRTTEEREHV